MAFSLADLFGGGSDGPPNTQDPGILYGVWLQSAGPWIEDLKPELDRLFAVRIANLAGIPPDWLKRVRELQANHPTSLVRIAPSRSGDVAGTPNRNAAWFLKAGKQLDGWMEIYQRSNQIISDYAANLDASWLTHFYNWVTNDENWLAIEQDFAAAWKATSDATVAGAKAVGTGVKAVYDETKSNLSDIGNYIDRFNPLSAFTKNATQAAWLIGGVMAAIVAFFLWKAGIFDSVAKAIPAAKKARKAKA